MKQKNIPELDRLFGEIGRYQKSSEYKELLEFVKKFPQLAPYNAMLIHIQKPGSNYVASASVWKRKFNRTINPGARPLVILRPFGPVAFVFELSDTNGRDLFPESLINPFKVEGEVSLYKYHKLINNLLSYGILYREEAYGASRAGSIQIGNFESEKRIEKVKKEVWIKTIYDLVVNNSHSRESKFATIVHELGHLFSGHLGTPYPNWWENRSHLSENEIEFEAESICWLVCERLGVKNPSAAYLNGYLDENKLIPRISIDTVLKSIGIIEKLLNTTVEPKKELIRIR